MTWGATTKARRARNAAKASRVAAANRAARKSHRQPKAPSEYRPGMHPNTREAVAREVRWVVACRTAEGWDVPAEQLRITERQDEFLATMAIFDCLHWGAMGDIAQALGMQRKSAWHLSSTLMRKFKVHNRHQLHAIALEIASNKRRRRLRANQFRGHSRSSTRASMFASVLGEPELGEHKTSSQTEALHPGAAPTCAL